MDMEFLKVIEQMEDVANSGEIVEASMGDGWLMKLYREYNGYSVAVVSPGGEMYMGEEINWHTYQEAVRYGMALHDWWASKP